MKSNQHVYSGHIFKGVYKIVGNDDLRPIFNIAIIVDGNMVATDAYHLIKINLSFFGIRDEDKDLFEGRYISRDVLIKLGRIKKNENWTIDENGINILDDSLNTVLSYSLGKATEIGTYPNFEAVIPTTKVELSRISLNAKFMINIENIYTVYTQCKHTNLVCHFYGETRPITMTANNFLGLVIPRRI